MSEKPGKLPKINDWDNIVRVINKSPKNFCIIQANSGFFGSIIYRAIIGSSDKFVWEKDMNGAVAGEELGPLEWPHKTEGYGIYALNYGRTYLWFKENHLATAHISHDMLEYTTARKLISKIREDKILLLKTHDMDVRDLKCNIVRVVGNIQNLTNLNDTNSIFRDRDGVTIDSVYQDNVFNLEVTKFMNDDFDIYCDEYLRLCLYLNLNPNINNVRQYILLLKDKINRYERTL
jgi:hypothetical protein